SWRQGGECRGCRGCDHGMAKARYQDARAEADPVGALGSATQRHEDVGTLMRRVEYPGPLEAEPFSDGDVVRSVHQRCEDAGELHLSILSRVMWRRRLAGKPGSWLDGHDLTRARSRRARRAMAHLWVSVGPS